MSKEEINPTNIEVCPECGIPMRACTAIGGFWKTDGSQNFEMEMTDMYRNEILVWAGKEPLAQPEPPQVEGRKLTGEEK